MCGGGAKMLDMLIPRVHRKLHVCIINMQKRESNESLSFISHFWAHCFKANNVDARARFFRYPSIWHSIILRELWFAFVFALLLLYHLSDAITSRLFYMLCIWAQYECQKWYPKDLFLLDSRIHAAFIGIRSVYIF